ncbi:MAG TPA: hypothetical protein VM451_09535 [Candidatus Limnocylindria bacterium]|nr:hypothetical protein [Candidatus Limnocylindria bacterium]
MGLVGEPVQIAAAPSKLDRQLGVQLSGDPAELPEHHFLESAPLDPGHHVLREAAAIGQVLLPPPEAMAECAISVTGSNVVHRRHDDAPRLRVDHLRLPGVVSARLIDGVTFERRFALAPRCGVRTSPSGRRWKGRAVDCTRKARSGPQIYP